MDLYEKIDGDFSTEDLSHTALETCIRVNLATTFEQKDEVKGMGAKWDGTARTWYITGDLYRADTESWSKYAPTAVVAETTADCPF